MTSSGLLRLIFEALSGYSWAQWVSYIKAHPKTFQKAIDKVAMICTRADMPTTKVEGPLQDFDNADWIATLSYAFQAERLNGVNRALLNGIWLRGPHMLSPRAHREPRVPASGRGLSCLPVARSLFWGLECRHWSHVPHVPPCGYPSD